MKNGPIIIITISECVAAIAEVLTTVLDGKAETKPDFSRLIQRILTALAGLRSA